MRTNGWTPNKRRYPGFINLRCINSSFIGIHFVAPLFDVFRAGTKAVVLFRKFLRQQSIQFGLDLRVLSLPDKIVQLIQIGFVIIKKPGAIEVSGVSETRSPEGPILAASASAQKFTKRRNAAQHRCAAGWVRSPAHRTGEVKSFDGFR